MSEILTVEGLAGMQPSDLTRERLEELKRNAASDVPTRRVIATYVADLAASAGKRRSAGKVHDTYFVLGALSWVLCRFDAAAESLAEVKRDDFARELEAECCLEAGRFKQALKLYTRLVEKTPCAAFDLSRVRCLRGLGRTDEADKVLKGFGEGYDDEADYHFEVGMMHDVHGEYALAVVAYDRALALASNHARSLFRLAYIADLRGDDEEALRLYERCAAIRPPHVNVLVNLGVLYEDLGRFEDAATCFKRVLAWNPNHDRAKLFLRDAASSLTMYYDEELERKVDRQNKVLEIPVTDFELSVRSRNCLERMNVKTLGDLTRVSESDLLGYKNFGETSLSEIKTMMAAKGLRLGQALEKETPLPATGAPEEETVPEGGGLTVRPIAELELSVRSRKCVQRLGVATIGVLCERSEEALLACKNFGQTSLNEIKQKLANLGLKLRDNK